MVPLLSWFGPLALIAPPRLAQVDIWACFPAYYVAQAQIDSKILSGWMPSLTSIVVQTPRSEMARLESEALGIPVPGVSSFISRSKRIHRVPKYSFKT